MIKMKFTKVLAVSLIAATVFILNPVGVSASWKHNSTGYWYTTKSNNTCVTGWKKIEGKWYYFYPNGYMAHDTVIDNFKLASNGVCILPQSKVSQYKIITVQNAQEFVNAIGSNTKILLKPGVYNLSTIKQINNSDNSVSWVTVEDGKELNIQGIHNLTIEGMNSGKVEIKVSPRFANIMNFTNVSNVTIKNIVAGHTPAPYECNAGVLKFTGSNNISLMNSELYGCGSIGVDLNNVKNLEASNCTIDHCSLRAIQILNSEAIKFTQNKIINHEAYSNIIMIQNSKGITFEQCEIANNNKFSWGFIEATDNSNVFFNKCIIKDNSKSSYNGVDSDNVYFFNTTNYSKKSDSKITIKDSQIINNKCDYLLDNVENIKLENCTVNNNAWK